MGWVDRLCIVQDDDSLKQCQIESMDIIYQLVNVSFLACSDRAGAGLPGTLMRPRQPSQQGTEWRFWGDMLVVSHVSVEESKWNTRGWTFQERLLSRLRIFFCDNHTYVECESDILEVPEKRSARLSEYRHCHHIWGYFRGSQFNISTRHHQDGSRSLQVRLSDYCELVSRYRTRVLGDRRDILNAFAGISKFISYGLGSDMLVGLPEKYLSQSLL